MESFPQIYDILHFFLCAQNDIFVPPKTKVLIFYVNSSLLYVKTAWYSNAEYVKEEAQCK